jgi:hypothetical protein
LITVGMAQRLACPFVYGVRSRGIKRIIGSLTAFTSVFSFKQDNPDELSFAETGGGFG